MKTLIKLFLVILFVAVSISSAQAQAHYRRSIYGDFFAGMTLASMDIEKGNEYKTNKIGLIVGGNVNYKIHKYFQLQSGFHIIKKGSLKHENRIEDLGGPQRKIDIKKTVDANYAQIPLNIGFEIPVKRDMFFNMHVGAFLAYGFKGESKQRGYTAMIINGDYKEQVSDNIDAVRTFSSNKLKRIDYGIGANLGLVYDIYILRLQYDHGMANVASDALGGTWKTRNYALCLGFRF